MSHTPGRSPRGKRGRKPDLQRRQRTLALRAEGLSVREIGRRLGVSRQTVCNDLKPAGPLAAMSARCADCGQAVGPGVYPPRGRAFCPDCLGRHPDAPFGTRLRSLRLAAGLTAQALGERAGMWAHTICAYEGGHKQPGWAVLCRLGRVLGPGLFPPGREKGPRLPRPASHATLEGAREFRRRVEELRAEGLSRREVAARLGATPEQVGHAELLARLGRPVVALPCRECGVTVATGPPTIRNNGAALCLACLARHPDASFADRLKAHRLAAGLTVMELGARLGISPQDVSDYEGGRTEPKLPRLAQLVAVLGPGLATLRPEGATGPERGGEG
jgi:transcriptional regulator with XRE-family HTH domain